MGDWVLAIGNPFGLGGSVTRASCRRTVGISEPGYDDFLQIDAPINRGNSGGPTFNLKGEVVGVNTMIYSPSGGSVGLAFAIPARTVLRLSMRSNATAALREAISAFRSRISTSRWPRACRWRRRAARSSTTSCGSVAAKAGLRSGDVIVTIDGAPLPTARDLIRRIGSLKPGEAILLGYVRDGRQQHVTLSLGRQQEASVHRPAADQPKRTKRRPCSASSSRLCRIGPRQGSPVS